MSEIVRRHATVAGRVQMVGFRAFVAGHAGALGLRGTVANRPDGTVECVVEGPRDDVDRLIGLLREGPRAARVADVTVVDEPRGGTLPPFMVTS